MRRARPILFTGPNVTNILSGRKTQTRRILKPLMGPGWRPETANGDPCRLGMITSPHPKKGRFGVFMRREIHPGTGKYEHDLVPCPYGAPGDLLWVREAWMGPLMSHAECMEYWRSGSAKFETPKHCQYAADGGPRPEYMDADDNLRQGWKPSIHMPRWASRLTLEITEVVVERLQDISNEDAVEEGIGTPRDLRYAIQDGFRPLWESINGTGSWAKNPWVWVVKFTAHPINVDRFLEDH